MNVHTKMFLIQKNFCEHPRLNLRGEVTRIISQINLRDKITRIVLRDRGGPRNIVTAHHVTHRK